MEGYKDSVEEEAAPVEEAAAPVEEVAAPAAAAPVATAAKVAGGVLKIHIGEGKDIDLSIPVGALGEGGSEVVEVAPAATTAALLPAVAIPAAPPRPMPSSPAPAAAAR